jgi:hypothetical protein
MEHMRYIHLGQLEKSAVAKDSFETGHNIQTPAAYPSWIRKQDIWTT